MNRKRKFEFGEWILLVLFWVAITLFTTWAYVSNFNSLLDIIGGKELALNNQYYGYIQSNLQYLEATIFGVLFGTAFFFINHFTDRNKLIKRSFGRVILIRSILYISAVLFTFAFIYTFYKVFGLFDNDQMLLDLSSKIGIEYFIVVGAFLLFYTLLTNFLLMVRRKFGPQNFVRLIMGHYYKPREESKIFLFIDLKGSTTIAEKLGHLAYSQLLRDCFHDITDIVLKYDAEVYQYVGDEIVLCWDSKDGLKNINCIKALISFRKKIEAKSTYYKSKYGVLPEFKGGIDMGVVTATEIGDIKRDIAYHGDVVNTASRIQEECNKYNKKLLVSERVVLKLNTLNGFSKELVGELRLRGKNEALKIYSIE